VSLQGKVDEVPFSFTPMQPKHLLPLNLHDGGRNILLSDGSSSVTNTSL